MWFGILLNVVCLPRHLVVAGDFKPSPHPGGEQARRQATERLTAIPLCVQPLPRSYPSSSSSSSSSSSNLLLLLQEIAPPLSAPFIRTPSCHSHQAPYHFNDKNIKATLPLPWCVHGTTVNSRRPTAFGVTKIMLLTSCCIVHLKSLSLTI